MPVIIDTTTIADFYKRFPEFCSIDEDRIRMSLREAQIIMHAPEHWCDPEIYALALAYLSAHLMFLANSTASGDSGSQFPLKRQEVDDVVIESAVKSVDIGTDPLYTTSYGQSYLRYRRMCFVGIYGV